MVHYINDGYYMENMVMRKRAISFILVTILMFFTIYKISILGLPEQLNSTRVSIIIAFIWSLFQNRGKITFTSNLTNRNFCKLLLFFVFLVLYSVIGLILGNGWNGTTITAMLLNFILFYSLAFWSFSKLYRNIDELMFSFIIITLIQCCVIDIGMVSSTFRSFIINTFNYSSYWNTAKDIEAMFNGGYSFGIGCMTSTGSLQMSLGYIGLMYFMIKDNTYIFLKWFIYIMFTISTIFLARTSLAISVLYLIFYVLRPSKSNKSKIASVIQIMLPFLCLAIVSYFSDTGFIIDRLRRVIRTFEYGVYKTYFEDYLYGYGNVIPGISIDTIIGTGLVSGSNGNGIVVNADGGYIRSFVALGLPMSLCFYLLMLYICSSNIIIKYSKLFIVDCFFLSLIFLGEIKEHWTLDYILFLYFLYMSLSSVERQTIRNQ